MDAQAMTNAILAAIQAANQAAAPPPNFAAVMQQAVTEEQEIVALRSQIDKLSKSKQKVSSQSTSGKTQKASKSRKSQRPFTGTLAWRNVSPKAGAPTTKVVKGQTYHWCKHHKFWGNHEYKDCRAAHKTSASNQQQPSQQHPPEDEITASLARVGIADVSEIEE